MFRLLQRSGVSRIAFVFSMLAATMLAALGALSAGSGAAAPAGSGPLGVYVGYQSPGGVSSFGRTIGKQPTFAMDFLDGDSWSALVNTAPSYMSAWKGSGYTMIWGLPMLPIRINPGTRCDGGLQLLLLAAGAGHGGGRAGQFDHPPGLGIQRRLVPLGRQRPGGRLRHLLAADRDHHAIGARPELHVRVEPDRG